MGLRLMAVWLGLVGCPSPEVPPPAPEPADGPVCDAGDAVWATRAMALTWGRRPHSSHEQRIWATAAGDIGREATLAAMMADPAYRTSMQAWLNDLLEVERAGDRTFPPCDHQRYLPDDPALAEFVRDRVPHGARYEFDFTMADLVASALTLDDISPVFRANLLVRMMRHPANGNVSIDDSAPAFRETWGEGFFRTYLGRDLDCLPCHNSEWSATGHADPALDRTWEIPGHFERALLGTAEGSDPTAYFAMFRYYDLVEFPDSRVNPWGFDPTCASLAPPSTLDDFLDQEAFFIRDHGQSGSVWELESHLHRGIDGLRAAGLTPADDGSVEPDRAFAYLVGTRVANEAWRLATGNPLTLEHGFPRTRAQRDQLKALADGFTEDWSLRGLLTDIALSPWFNPAAPAVCPGGPHWSAPVWDPTTDALDPPENNPGDRIQRLPPRTALRSLHHVMGWPEPPDFYPWTDEFTPVAPFHQSFGVFLQVVANSGPAPMAFDTLLAWQHEYGACRPRDDLFDSGGTCGLPELNQLTCACACEECVCRDMPQCCEPEETAWDAACADHCLTACGGCAAEMVFMGDAPDTLDALITQAITEDRPVDHVVSALRDRLLLSPTMSSTERALVQDLLGRPLASATTAEPALEAGLRRVCGAMLSAPDLLLELAPALATTSSPIPLDAEADCTRLEQLTATAGQATACH